MNFHILDHKKTQSTFTPEKGKLFFPTPEALQAFMKGVDDAKSIGVISGLNIKPELDYYVVVVNHPNNSYRQFAFPNVTDSLSYCFGLTMNVTPTFDTLYGQEARTICMQPEPAGFVFFTIDFVPSALSAFIKEGVIDYADKTEITEPHYQSYKKLLRNSQYITFFIIDTADLQVIFNLGTLLPVYYCDKKNNRCYAVHLEQYQTA